MAKRDDELLIVENDAPGMAVYSGPSLYEQYLRENPIQAKPTYADSYSGQMADLYGKITGRGAFRYDATKDPLYQGMKDQYIRSGKMAMTDTMGQAAALTGGYANTYGQQVGQQAYDAYMQNLTEVIPTLYQTAYDQYKDQGDQLMQQYGLLGDLRDQEYGRYRDELSDWNTERAYLADLENEDYRRRTQAEQLQYSREQDAYNRQWNEENRSYSRQQDAYANLYAMIKASGYVPSDSELAAAGMSRAAADAIAAEYQRGVDMDERNMSLRENSAYSSGGGGGGGSSGRSYGGGGGYTDNVLGKTVTYSGGSDTGSLADWWNAASSAGYSDNVLYQTLERVYADNNYGPAGDTMVMPTTDAGKARLEKLKQRMASK